jgi:environmental stress-induced protein Ves
MTIQILHAWNRLQTPWKNGGGVTREIAASPTGADLAGFDWRVSMATVASGGPFSTFPGVDRLMLVLEGALRLDIAGGEPLTLDAASAAAEFPGDAEVTAAAPAAPVIDVNVMVRRGRFTASLERRRVAGAGAAVCQDVTLILGRQGGLSAAIGAERYEFEADDVLRIDGARGALARLTGDGEIILAHINAVR